MWGIFEFMSKILSPIFFSYIASFISLLVCCWFIMVLIFDISAFSVYLYCTLSYWFSSLSQIHIWIFSTTAFSNKILALSIRT